MRTSTLILRITQPCARNKPIVNNIIGTLDAANFAKLVDVADLSANPRECRVGPITKDIIESLEENPSLFEHKTKGMLLACKSCTSLERDRFKLEFVEQEIEGVLDGGHNMLATAIHILDTSLRSVDKQLPNVKTWDDLVPVWETNRKLVEQNLEDFTFQMPIEIKHALDEEGGDDLFAASILDISQARNNNRELALEAKSNKAGHYDYLQLALDPDINEQVEWKTNSGGRLRVREIVALATIPLSKVKSPIPELNKISPVMIYRNKGHCLKLFEDLMKNDSVAQTTGSIRKLHHPEVMSALDLMRDIPRIYDWIYEKFPEAYNKKSPRFGAISSVRTFHERDKDFDQKRHIRQKPKTRFYEKEVKFDYPEGFITPIVWGLSELIESDGQKLRWKVDPTKFLEKNLPMLMDVYYGMIQMTSYDPQGVGKNTASYSLIAQLIASQLRT